MGKSFADTRNDKKKEGLNMTSEQVRGYRIDHRARMLQSIGSDIEPDVLRLTLKNWDERRVGMRESLPGDRRK